MNWYQTVKAEFNQIANGGLVCQKCGKPLSTVKSYCDKCDPHKGEPIVDTAYGLNGDHRPIQSRAQSLMGLNKFVSTILKFEKDLLSKVIGQDDAVKQFVNAYKMVISGYRPDKTIKNLCK